MEAALAPSTFGANASAAARVQRQLAAAGAVLGAVAAALPAACAAVCGGRPLQAALAAVEALLDSAAVAGAVGSAACGAAHANTTSGGASGSSAAAVDVALLSPAQVAVLSGALCLLQTALSAIGPAIATATGKESGWPETSLPAVAARCLAALQRLQFARGDSCTGWVAQAQVRGRTCVHFL